MDLSLIGAKMAQMSGLRSIMEDVANTAPSRPSEWLNLSIGNPAKIPEVTETWHRIAMETVAEQFTTASLQYGPSRGAPELIEAIIRYFNQRYGWELSEHNVVIGPGSQMLCFAAAALFTGVNASGMNRVVLPITPDYTGYQGLCLSADGIAGIGSDIEKIGDRQFKYLLNRQALEERSDIGMMLLSSPSNPTGRSIDADELAALADVSLRRDVPLLIDHAYGDPFPRIGEVLTGPTFHSNIINSFSFSKAGVPGERIGFAIAPVRYINPIVSFLSNSVLHASRFAQGVAAKAISSGELDNMVRAHITPFYERRRKIAEDLLTVAMPERVAWRIHAGVGGMFCWVWVDEEWFDDLDLYDRLKVKKVFIAPGRNFFVEPARSAALGRHARRCFRISLTTSAEALESGIDRIAEAIREMRDDPRRP